MPTVCMQCAMKALVNGGIPGMGAASTFDETPEEHMARVHPDIEQTLRERMKLEIAVMQLLDEDPWEQGTMGKDSHHDEC